MQRELIGGVPVCFRNAGKHLDQARKAVVHETGALALRRPAAIEVTGRVSGFSITYRFRDPEVDVTITEGHARCQVAAALLRNAKRIATHEAAREGPRMIDRADAVVALRTGARDILASFAGVDAGPLGLTTWQKGSGDTVNEPKVWAATPGGRVDLSGARITATYHDERQQWANRSLTLVGRRTLPEALMLAVRGRNIDEIVGDTLLAGAGLRVHKAWVGGGRIGLTTVADPITLDEALALDVAPVTRLAA